MAPDLTPITQGQSAVRRNYANNTAANAFSKTLSQKRGNRQLGSFQRNFQRQLPKFTAGFGQRGLSGPNRSGVMQRAMNQYLGDYTRDLGYMKDDLNDELRQFDFNDARFAAERDAALASLEAQKAAIIAQTAQAVNGLKPFMS